MTMGDYLFGVISVVALVLWMRIDHWRNIVNVNSRDLWKLEQEVESLKDHVKD